MNMAISTGAVNQLNRGIFWIAILVIVGCQGENLPGSYSSEHELNLNRMERLIPLHKELGPPRPGDWLYEHKEKGQTFSQYTKLKPLAPYEGKEKIYLLPIGVFDEAQALVISKTADYLSAFFGLEVVVQEALPDSVIPAIAKRMHDGNYQINAKHILDSILLKDFPDDALLYTAVTNIDLFPRESWNYVFGLSYLTKKVGVSSMYRYITKDLSVKNHTTCLKRLSRTCSHELTHMFSLKHCKKHQCVMNGSNSLAESDRKPMWLCPDCLLKFSWCTGYSVTERYDNLIRFDTANDFIETSQFLIKSKNIIAN